MRSALLLLLCVACSRSTPTPSPAPSSSASAPIVVATASASTAAPKHPDAPPRQACEGANIDLGWALRGQSCKRQKDEDAGANDVSSLRATMGPLVVGADAVKTTKLDVWIENTRDVPVVLDLARGEPRVEPLNAEGQTAQDKLMADFGMIGMINAGSTDGARVTIAPKGWAYVKASLADTDPNHPGTLRRGAKRDAGAQSLPPGTYRVVLSSLRKLAIAAPLEVR